MPGAWELMSVPAQVFRHEPYNSAVRPMTAVLWPDLAFPFVSKRSCECLVHAAALVNGLHASWQAVRRCRCMAATELAMQVDVYAFAMIAFELFEGRIPFQGEKPMIAARKAATEHARPAFGAQNRRVLTTSTSSASLSA